MNKKLTNVEAAGVEPAAQDISVCFNSQQIAPAPKLHRIKTFLILLLIVMLSGCTSIKNNVKSWDRYDTAYQATYLAITAVDYAQTRWMARQDWYFEGRSHTEVCPLLSKRPSTGEVDILIPLGMVAHTAIAFALPPKYKVLGFEINPRRIWQIIFIVTEAGAVGNNMGIGARIEF